MPKPKATRFTAFEFTDDEMFAATRFSQLSLMLIQSLAADAIENKAQLKIDLQSGKPLAEANIEFMQREAELSGEIGAYEHLLLLAAETVVPQTSNS
jgi:hypothetical protein